MAQLKTSAGNAIPSINSLLKKANIAVTPEVSNHWQQRAVHDKKFSSGDAGALLGAMQFAKSKGSPITAWKMSTSQPSNPQPKPAAKPPSRAAQNQQAVKQEFSQLPSAQDNARKLEQEREQRLQALVDPVLQNQQNVLEQMKQQTSIEDFFNQLRQDKGLDQQESAIKDLTGQTTDVTRLLQSLPQSVQDQVRGTMTTEGQRQRVEAQQRQPLTEQLQVLSGLLTNARGGFQESMQGISQALGLRQASQSQEMAPILKALEFSGQNLDRSRGDEAARLQNMVQAFGQDQGSAIAQIQQALAMRSQDQTLDHQKMLQTLAQQFQSGQQDDQQSFLKEQGDVDFGRQQELMRLQAALAPKGGSTGGGSMPAALQELQTLMGLLGQDQAIQALYGIEPPDRQGMLNNALTQAGDQATAGGFFSPQPKGERNFLWSGVGARDIFREIPGVIGGAFKGAKQRAQNEKSRQQNRAPKRTSEDIFSQPLLPSLPSSIF